MYGGFQPTEMRSRSISVTAILDDAFSLLRENIRLCFGIVAILVAPLTLLSSFLSNRAVTDAQPHMQRLTDLSDRLQRNEPVSNSEWSRALAPVAKDFAKILAIVGGISLLEYSLVGGALAIAVCKRYLLLETSFSQCYRLAFRRFGGVLLASLATALLLVLIFAAPASIAAVAGAPGVAALLLMASMIAVVIIGVRASLILPVAAIERRGLSALRRSFSLTEGYFRKTAGMLVMTTVVVYLLTLLTNTIVMHATSGNNLIDTIANVIISAATTPLVLCAQTLLYVALRKKQERLTDEVLEAELSAGL